ncbi:heat shock protein DnaJ, partial [Mytilinidion resinicola]
MSPYATLNVPTDADIKRIKKAYRELCLQYHPDRISDPAQREVGQEKFKEIQNAYETLSDVPKRADLD